MHVVGHFLSGHIVFGRISTENGRRTSDVRLLSRALDVCFKTTIYGALELLRAAAAKAPAKSWECLQEGLCLVLVTFFPVPSKSPMLTVVQAISKSQIRLTWIPLAQSDLNGVLLGHNIFVREDSASDNRTIQSAANTFNLAITGLQPYTVYWVAVSALTKIGSGPVSNETKVLTNESGENWF